jgi:hypothetical protein
MAFIFYGDVSTAIKLSGLTLESSDVSTELQEIINNWINSEIKFEGFGSPVEAVEYYDINRQYQSELMLKKFPVTDVTELIDGFNSINKTLMVKDKDFVIDKETGIIQIIHNNEQYNLFAKKYFSVGHNSVKVTYKYGFESVPDLIKSIASLALAKQLKIGSYSNDTGNIKSIKIGNWGESYDTDMGNIKQEYDDKIKSMIIKAKQQFGGY